jgi:tetratricopeptide (TPR) repeat protein
MHPHGAKTDDGLPPDSFPAASSPRPLVSVLVRSMDRPTLGRALDSIAAQTWTPLEIVVAAACGESHRPLPDLHDGRPLRLVFAEDGRRLPRAEAANVCLDAAHGEWLVFLDDDDEFLPQHLETLVTASRSTSAKVVYSRTQVLDENGRPAGHCGFAGFHAQLYYQSRSTSNATLFHRSLVAEGARFDPSFAVLEDHDFFVNLASRTQFHFVDATTCVWHGCSGGSGTGFGFNDRSDALAAVYAELRLKWAAHFDRWLAEPEALLFLGQHGLRTGDPSSALPYLERVLSLRPDDVNALNLCGLANLHVGNLDRAEDLLGRAVRKMPAHSGLTENLALVRATRRTALPRSAKS